MPDDETGLPNFQAFKDYVDAQVGVPHFVQTPIKAWAAKMEEWAKARVAEIEALRDQANGLEQDATHLKDNEAEYDELREKFIDFDRGLLDVDDMRQLGRDLRDQRRTEERTEFP